LPKDLSKEKIIYFPLHMEPERTLLKFSNEFNNQFEAIVWISKNIPAGWLLVVKEQPKALGHRRTESYTLLRSMANVVLSKPEISSRDWIANARIVVTISGTVGEESVHLERPVVTFGRHQIINGLPTVYTITGFDDAKGVLDHLTTSGESETRLYKSKISLHNAVQALSFSMVGYASNYTSDVFQESDATLAIKELVKAYPELSFISPEEYDSPIEIS